MEYDTGRVSAEEPQPTPTEQLKASLRTLLATLIERGFGIALDKIEQLARTFDQIAARGGITLHAAFGGAQAALEGRSPVWGAIRGAFSALSPGTKAIVVAVLILALILLPVTVVLLLLSLIVIAIVLANRTRSTA
ncbi:hypothetical protein [Pseudonocardia aurantiaca]|uniref:DUF4342 domain-containing protein n=1 Tax=Pseudonocardia aurantiaca TaxID=75290 RepID=A0ABW4FKY6_9PSEU